ncbi:adenosylcobinamide-phosphate synthase CbiB [Paracoccaceae bacterium]|nr:adenosylcobinamide-phosphate synthase CbiB [Paracoccaceae bacterium]
MAWLLFFALILDTVLGEPEWLWSRVRHPAVLMGNFISTCTKRLNSGANRKQKGIAVLLLGLSIAMGLGFLLSLIGPIFETLIAASLLAHKSLVQHVIAVAKGLRLSLTQGRNAISRIVGRDTSQMNIAQISRAGIESGAENFSDGVVAPAFYFLIGGLPGMLLYKFTNTADSMIGYKTKELQEFGWAAARFDDLLNFIPARLSAAIILLVSGHWSGLSKLSENAKTHASPNAGWPEAAMALALNVALAGPRSYHGRLTDFAWIHPNGNRHPDAYEIERSVDILWKSWAALLALVVISAILSTMVH